MKKKKKKKKFLYPNLSILSICNKFRYKFRKYIRNLDWLAIKKKKLYWSCWSLPFNWPSFTLFWGHSLREHHVESDSYLFLASSGSCRGFFHVHWCSTHLQTDCLFKRKQRPEFLVWTFLTKAFWSVTLLDVRHERTADVVPIITLILLRQNCTWEVVLIVWRYHILRWYLYFIYLINTAYLSFIKWLSMQTCQLSKYYCLRCSTYQIFFIVNLSSIQRLSSWNLSTIK